jgi:hypothetical protein
MSGRWPTSKCEFCLILHHSYSDDHPFGRDHLTHAQLKDLCQEYHRNITGNKATLQSNLKTFSADKKLWDE